MKIAIFFAILFMATQSLFAQETKKIDQIFEDWGQENHPGGVVLVSKGSEVLYSKAYGLANIQYKIPNTTESIFNLASVSKQFTALGIALLCGEGRLSLDDSIQKYLPELPYFGHKITIKHLLHHTSGLRSTPELFGLAGWRENEPISTEDDFNYICKQTSLNFKPGTEFMYSNSNYVLLALIISRITQQDFEKWMNSEVFEPLNMTETYIDASNKKRTANTVTPYLETENSQFQIAQNSSLDIGAANVYSSAPELLKWLKVLDNPNEKWAKAVKFLLTRDTLANGIVHEYACGLMIDEYKGNRRIYHTGGIPGSLSFTMYFPDEDLSFIILSNYLDMNAHKRVDMLLSLFIRDKSGNAKIDVKIKTKALNIKKASNYCKDYWNIKENYSRSVVLENNKLWYVRTKGNRSPLEQIEDSGFVIGGMKTMVTVKFKQHKDQLYMYVKDGDKPEQVFEPYDNSPPTGSDLNSYCGAYYSPELETSYTISIADGGLLGYHSRHGYFGVEVLRKGVLNWSGMAIARYKYNDQGNVSGFYVTLNRVRNVWFEKK